jgi:membrane protein implicated in regulation of membrane protease activity
MARSVRETYDLPERPPFPFRQWALILGLIAAALILWVVLPDSPITVALLALFLLAIVFIGVARLLSSRELREPPGRNPTTPPSAR